VKNYSDFGGHGRSFAFVRSLLAGPERFGIDGEVGRLMAVTLKLKISEASEAVFKKAVFRFIEANLPAFDQDMSLTTGFSIDPDWIRADVVFSDSDLARRFRQFLGMRHPEVIVAQI
jgi:hypothetical protein